MPQAVPPHRDLAFLSGGGAMGALTGYGQEDDVRRSRNAGSDHHMTKSADFESLHDDHSSH